MKVLVLCHPDIPGKAIQPFKKLISDVEWHTNLNFAEGVEAALIFGGDGTVHRNLSELSKYKIPTLVVPSGSGNDFAKAIGIGNATIALETWKRFCTKGENTREIDLGLVRSSTGSETLFCSVAAIGMDAEANRLANAMPSWLRRRGGYIVAALCALASFKVRKFNMMAEVPNKREEAAPRVERHLIRRSGFFAAVGQTQRYGG